MINLVNSGLSSSIWIEMITIVNRRGQLFNDDGDGYELDQNVSTLVFNSRIESRFYVTEDGRAFDTRYMNHVDLDSDAKLVTIYDGDHNRVSKTLAIAEDGEIYRFSINRGAPRQIFKSVGIKADFLCDSANGSYIKDGIYRSLGYDFEFEIVGKIIDVKSKIVITNDRILVFVDNLPHVAYRMGKLIGCEYINIPLGDDEDKRYVVIIEEDDEGELLLRCNFIVMNGRPNVNNFGESETYDIICDNEFLINMHRELPWIDLVKYEEKPHLVRLDGTVVELGLECMFTSSKIPSYIFGTPINKKNPRTRI